MSALLRLIKFRQNGASGGGGGPPPTGSIVIGGVALTVGATAVTIG